MESIQLAFTYDDVLLVPGFSSVKTRREVNCATSFTRQIGLKAPFISARMDTVTEAPMAIAMAEFGGIGVIHRFLPIDVQVGEVSRVKRYQSEVIEDPCTIAPDATVWDASHMSSKWLYNKRAREAVLRLCLLAPRDRI